MIYLAALGCLGVVGALIAVPWLFNAVGERIARREWHGADADWAVRQLTSEHPLDQPTDQPDRQPDGQLTEPLRIVVSES
jgi:hypothetical protein